MPIETYKPRIKGFSSIDVRKTTDGDIEIIKGKGFDGIEDNVISFPPFVVELLISELKKVGDK